MLAGGYEDTRDFGNTILYTGQGGRDPETGRQVAHQTVTRGNLALACNKLYGLARTRHSRSTPAVAIRA